MTCHVGKVVAIEKSLLCEKDLQTLRDTLTITQENAYAKDVELEVFKENDEYIFVPKALGLRKIRLNDWESKSYETTSPVKWPPICLSEGYRPGQEEAIEETTRALRRASGGLLDAPTGAGKGLISLNVAANLCQRTLVLVHKEDLATMWRKTAQIFYPGVSVGHVQQDVWNYKDKHLVTALYQTVHSRSKELPKDFLEQFGLVVVEEGHRVSAPTFVNAVSKFPAKYRLGVSATWKRKDGLDCLFYWLLGDTAHSMKVEQLSCKYFPVTLPFVVRDAEFRKYRSKDLNPAKMISRISEMGVYNDYLADQATKAVRSGRKVMILTDRLKQVAALKRRLTGFVVCEYVGGSSKEEQSKAHVSDVVIGTYAAAGIGTDIPRLDTLILATPRSDITQAVGRIRRPHPEKKTPVIVDPVLSGSGYLRALAKKRLQQYQMLGFEEMKSG